MSARGKTLAGAGALVVLVAAVAAYGRYGYDVWRWGCPTDADLDRAQSVEGVAAAFAWHGMALEPISLPVWLPPSEPAYRGAQAFRYQASGATAYVLVCRERCAISRFRFGEARRVGEQRWRLGMDSNNNVPIWVTEVNRRAGTRMLEAIAGPQARVQPYIAYGSRCYVR